MLSPKTKTRPRSGAPSPKATNSKADQHRMANAKIERLAKRQIFISYILSHLFEGSSRMPRLGTIRRGVTQPRTEGMSFLLVCARGQCGLEIRVTVPQSRE